MTRIRHKPVRTCVGCGQRDLQSVMVRVVRDDGGQLCVDAKRRLAGRGGYLHHAENCWENFARRKGLIRALGANVDRKARSVLVERLRQGAEG